MVQSAMFTLEVDGFTGPLALLLDLIEQRKLQVNDISLSKVADDYIQYIEDRANVPLSETAQFIVVASTLLLIKSRSLLPTIELTYEEEEDIRDLEYRLLLYGHVRYAAKLLRQNWDKKAYLPRNLPQKEVVFTPSEDIQVENVLQSAVRLVASIPTFIKTPTAHVARELRLEDVIESLTVRMRSAFTDSFKRMTSGADRIEAIVHFLALLELVKRGTIGAKQTESFADITLQHEDLDTPHYG